MNTETENFIVEYCRKHLVAIFFDTHEEFLKIQTLFGVEEKEANSCGPMEYKWVDGVCSFSHVKHPRLQATTTYQCSSKKNDYWVKDSEGWIRMTAKQIIGLADDGISVFSLLG